MTRSSVWWGALVTLVALLATACGGSAPASDPSPSVSPTLASPAAVSPTPTPTAFNAKKCKFPKKKPFPSWVPKDLPFPPGTYAYRNFPKLSGYERALFVVRVGTTQIAKLVLKQWPKAGYVLGRGDSEPGEVEDSFTKAPASGAFKANDVFCTPGYTVMYLVYANKGPVIPAPSPTASNTKPLVNKHHH